MNLSHYTGVEKEVLATAKILMKLRILTSNAFPDLSESVDLVTGAYNDAANQHKVPMDSPLRQYIPQLSSS